MEQTNTIRDIMRVDVFDYRSTNLEGLDYAESFKIDTKKLKEEERLDEDRKRQQAIITILLAHGPDLTYEQIIQLLGFEDLKDNELNALKSKVRFVVGQLLDDQIITEFKKVRPRVFRLLQNPPTRYFFSEDQRLNTLRMTALLKNRTLTLEEIAELINKFPEETLQYLQSMPNIRVLSRVKNGTSEFEKLYTLK